MLKRPWQIWLLFFMSLAVVLPAMGWLTYKAMQLDEREAAARAETVAARRQAELEEDISRALWRMDTWMTPLMAQEAARPWFVYQSAYAGNAGGKGGKKVSQIASPLLTQPSPYILLHFQLSADGRLVSPQTPPPKLNDFALDNGSTLASIETSQVRLSELQQSLQFDRLNDRLPQQWIPTLALAELASNNVSYANSNLDPFNAAPQSQELQGYEQIANAQPVFQPPVSPRQSGRQLPQQPQVSLPPTTYEQTENAPPQVPPAPSRTDNRQISRSPVQTEGEPVNPTEVSQSIDRPLAAPEEALGQPQGYRAGNDYGRYQEVRTQVDQQERGTTDFVRRNQAFQQYAQRAVVEQRVFNEVAAEVTAWSEGVSRPLWIDGRLLLARRASAGGETVVQGCWFNWDMVQASLFAEIADLLPEAQLAPVGPDEPADPSRMLATLPVRLVVPEPLAGTFTGGSSLVAGEVSPMLVSLALAWLCLLLATIAVAMLLLGVVSLSERRGAFVSAVTHELRTPLTTFRMYAEMLSEGMVVDEDQQRSYLETLRREADRLSHLVENVLSYARLERGRRGGRRETLSLAELLEPMQPRLADRARQAEMELVVDCDEEQLSAMLHTDPAAVEQILFNLVDNACKYAHEATDRRIVITAERSGAGASLHITDHGPGLSAQAARRLFQPFSKSDRDAAHSAPGVGLGLALCRRLALHLSGNLRLSQSTPLQTTFTLTLPPAVTKGS